MIRLLYCLTAFFWDHRIFTGAITANGDFCEVQGLYVPLGETWQPAGKCFQLTCEGTNRTTSKGCNTPVPIEGWVLIPEDPSREYPDCCSQYVPPDSPLATKPSNQTATPAPTEQATNSSSSEDESESSSLESSESFDCCFECCYHCCMELLGNRSRNEFDSSEESDEYEDSDESDESDESESYEDY